MSIVQTLKQAVRTQYRRQPGGLDSLELRGSNYGALNLYKKQTASPTGIVTADLKTSLEQSFGNTVQVPVIDWINPAIGNVRTCAVQVGGLTTKLVEFTAVTMTFGFPMIRSQFKNNAISEQDYFFRMFEARRLASLELLDTWAVDHLDDNKNQYFPTEILQYYPEANDALQVPGDKEERIEFYNQIRSILSTMDLTGNPDVVTNPMAMGDIRTVLGAGTTDAGDLSYVLASVGSFFESNRVVAGPGNRAAMYLVGANAVGLVTRIDPDCERGDTHGGSENPVREWTTQDVPGIGTMGLYYRADCSDQSALLAAQNLQGLTRTSVESFEWSIDVFFIKAYNSDNAGRFFPIIKVEQKTAA
jgi:hypothetical protein